MEQNEKEEVGETKREGGRRWREKRGRKQGFKNMNEEEGGSEENSDRRNGAKRKAEVEGRIMMGKKREKSKRGNGRGKKTRKEEKKRYIKREE